MQLGRTEPSTCSNYSFSICAFLPSEKVLALLAMEEVDDLGGE